jgi:hypothetical protein
MVDEELNPNDAAVRELRAKAEERAERVLAGETPWEEEGDPEAADAGFDSVEEPRDDDVGETTSDSPEVVNPDEVAINEEVTPPEG